MNDWATVKQFEDMICQYTGSKYAVAVDSCTNAIFLSLKYCKEDSDSLHIPKHTYVNVPNMILHSGKTVSFTNESWQMLGYYQLFPSNIIDSACLFTSGMYIPNTYYCVSFQERKVLKIGKGGAILHDNDEADEWFREVRLNDRWREPKYIGYNMYMTPQQAAKGIQLLQNLPLHNKPLIFDYPDLSGYKIYDNISNGR